LLLKQPQALLPPTQPQAPGGVSEPSQTLTELRVKELRTFVAAELRAPAAATGAADAALATCAGASQAATGAFASDAATSARRRLRAVVVLHLHGEASLRLRSHLGGVADLPSRSRSSKVQQHVVKVFLRLGLSCESRKRWKLWETRQLRP